MAATAKAPTKIQERNGTRNSSKVQMLSNVEATKPTEFWKQTDLTE